MRLKKKLKPYSVIIIYLKTREDNKIKFKPVKSENNKGIQYYNISIIFISLESLYINIFIHYNLR